MKVFNETSLLKNMSVVLIITFIFFSIFTTSIIVNYHKEQLEREAIDIKNDYINIHRELIKKEVDKIHNMDKQKYKSVVFEDFDEQYMYFFAIALFFLLIEFLIGEKRGRNLFKSVRRK